MPTFKCTFKFQLEMRLSAAYISRWEFNDAITLYRSQHESITLIQWEGDVKETWMTLSNSDML